MGSGNSSVKAYVEGDNQDNKDTKDTDQINQGRNAEQDEASGSVDQHGGRIQKGEEKAVPLMKGDSKSSPDGEDRSAHPLFEIQSGDILRNTVEDGDAASTRQYESNPDGEDRSVHPLFEIQSGDSLRNTVEDGDAASTRQYEEDMISDSPVDDTQTLDTLGNIQGDGDAESISVKEDSKTVLQFEETGSALQDEDLDLDFQQETFTWIPCKLFDWSGGVRSTGNLLTNGIEKSSFTTPLCSWNEQLWREKEKKTKLGNWMQFSIYNCEASCQSVLTWLAWLTGSWMHVKQKILWIWLWAAWAVTLVENNRERFEL